MTTWQWFAEGHTTGWVRLGFALQPDWPQSLWTFHCYGNWTPAIHSKWGCLSHTQKLLNLLKFIISKLSHMKWIPCVHGIECMFLEVSTMYQTYLLAEAAMEYLICLFSSHRRCGKYSWPSKSGSDTLAAKFRNSHKMWPALLTSQESLWYLRGSGPRQMRWKQAQSLDYCSLDRGQIRSDQQLPTVAHNMPQVISRTWSNKMNLIYESYSWTWADTLYRPPHFANVKTETQSCE